MIQCHFINYYLNTLLLQFLQYLQQCAMNLLHTLNNFNTLLDNAKQTFKKLTTLKPFPTDTQEIKVEKGSINDTTMASQAKIDEDEPVYIEQKVHLSQDYTSKEKRGFQQKGPKLIQATCEKRHQNISYYNNDGKELSFEQGRQIQQENEQNKSRKRTRCFEGETFEYEYCRLLKKYVKNDCIPSEREENYTEIHYEMGKFTIRDIGQGKKQEGVTKVTFRKTSQISNPAKRPSYLHPTDLPDLGNYTINYSMEDLAQMTYEQITTVPKLTISTPWGKVHFLEPVSLFRKDIDACLKVSQNSIQIVDSEWRSKKMRLSVYQSAVLNSQSFQKMKKSAFEIGLTNMTYSDRKDSYIFSAH